VFVQIYKAIWLVIRQRPEQRGVDDAENRSVRADSERQRQRGDQREAGMFQQHSRSVSQVLPERF